MKSKLRILLMTALCLVCLFAFTACGSGVEIGPNGNWFVDGKDTGVSAAGEDGSRVEIGPNGHWYIDGEDTGVSAVPSDEPVSIGQNGNWFVGGEDTGIAAAGEDGSVVTVGPDGHWYIDGVDTGFAVGSDLDPQGLEYCPLEDGTYAVAVGSARLLRSVEIPARFNGREVSAVLADGFAGAASLESVVLPEGLTRIGEGAFRGCTSLRQVAVPSTLEEIGASAFEGCAALGEISLPASLASVGPGAFASCAGLTRVLFEQPEGWAVAEDEQSEPVPVSGTDLASGLIAAEMLTNTRCRCFWSKPDAAPGDPGEEGANG